MKRIIFGFWATLLLFACGGKGGHEEVLPTGDSLVADVLPADSAEVEVEPPKMADELFDDFIYDFMKNAKFQRSRISFPLPYQTDGKRELIEAGQWKFDRLFSQQEVYTMIFNSEEEARKEKDTSITRVAVEWLYLASNRVKQYVFERRHEGWMLTGIEARMLQASDDREFLAFYRQFVNDSVYQRRHVSQSLQFQTYDEEEFQVVDGVLDVDQWFVFRPELPDGTITNINYGSAESDSDTRIFVICSQSTGMNCSLKFRRTGRGWMLVRFEN